MIHCLLQINASLDAPGICGPKFYLVTRFRVARFPEKLRQELFLVRSQGIAQIHMEKYMGEGSRAEEGRKCSAEK